MVGSSPARQPRAWTSSVNSVRRSASPSSSTVSAASIAVILENGLLSPERTRRVSGGDELLEVGFAPLIERAHAFQPVFGTHQTTEVILWQRVVNPKAVMWMLGHDLPPEASAPGTWLHDALEVRDRWESRLLRSAAWSPLY